MNISPVNYNYGRVAFGRKESKAVRNKREYNLANSGHLAYKNGVFDPEATRKRIEGYEKQRGRVQNGLSLLAAATAMGLGVIPLMTTSCTDPYIIIEGDHVKIHDSIPINVNVNTSNNCGCDGGGGGTCRPDTVEIPVYLPPVHDTIIKTDTVDRIVEVPVPGDTIHEIHYDTIREVRYDTIVINIPGKDTTIYVPRNLHINNELIKKLNHYFNTVGADIKDDELIANITAVEMYRAMVTQAIFNNAETDYKQVNDSTFNASRIAFNVKQTDHSKDPAEEHNQLWNFELVPNHPDQLKKSVYDIDENGDHTWVSTETLRISTQGGKPTVFSTRSTGYGAENRYYQESELPHPSSGNTFWATEYFDYYGGTTEQEIKLSLDTAKPE
ncbi:MAG: hypothetical protein LBK53_03705 [Heliobacteriaceae bacterium]|jgi:hypothetical protein|nr:hypothetical protein [Heliobacteriaceae bacterium]